MRKMANKLARLKVEYELEVRDKDGKLIQRVEGVAKSLLRMFMYWLRSKFTITASTGYASSWTWTDTGNIARTSPYGGTLAEGYWGHFGVGVNVDAKGIVVGTSDTPVTPTQYNLLGKIAQGSGAGQLVHGAQTVEDVEIVDSSSRFRATRVFTNNSGASITVREIGLIMSMCDNAGAERYGLVLRDVLPSPTSIPDGATLTVRYRSSVTA